MSRQDVSRFARRSALMASAALAMLMASASEARAHCDTMDGPVVAAARTALESGSLAHVLIWVRAQDEAEIRRAFAQTRAVRAQGKEARELADLWFFETVVRLHRQGEGEPYTGLKPAGTDLGPAIPAADRALAAGNVGQLEQLLVHQIRDRLRERFADAVKAKGFDTTDVAAGRAYVAAYVALAHYVEQVHALATAGGEHKDAHTAAGAHRAP